ncbi:MAG: prolyl oligopeptidase family serine peptidase [Betaproteobacteria bacterium]
MRTHARAAWAAAALAASLAVLHAAGAPPQSAQAPFALTVDSIMRGPKLVGYPPTGLRWSGDSARLYFEWRRPGEDESATWVVGRDGTGLRQLTDEERRSAPPVRGEWDAAHRRVLFVDDGDIVLVDSVAGTRRTITRTTAAEANPRWARHDTAVTFTRDDNLFLVTLDGGGLEQLTDIAPKKREPSVTDSQKYVKAEEEQLIEHTRVEEQKKKKQEAKKKAHALPKLELQDRQTASDLQLSPDGAHVFVLVLEHAEGARRGLVPNYVTESAYVEDITGRTAVGDAQDKRMLAVMNLRNGKTVWADASFAGPGRAVNWSMPVLSDTGAVTIAHARAADNKDRWLVALDPDSGTCRVVDALHDDAWIREPGGFGPGGAGSYGWLADNAHIWFLSERDGWMHLYTVDAAAPGASPAQLTSGRWEITSAELSQDKKIFHLTTTEASPGERHIYAMSVDGGARTKLTSMTGSNTGRVSPDGGTVGLVYSYSNKPPEVYVMAVPKGTASQRAARQVTTTPTEEWRAFKWADPQLITYKARDGAQVYARLYTPEMMGARRDPNAPAVIFVHGAGYAQNAHRYWSSYYREYMFHNLLASRGYVVLDPDYRASAGYGRDWRTSIYRHMGGKDLDDVVDGAKYLVASQKVNPKRIGIYGGSYGGFITLMAMFTSPDTFAAGAALRPVSDWAHYNHPYTSDILNEPQKDPEAYHRSSPIYFADGLKGALLICHGMVDTNVFFQDTVRLVQRLIELRKPNWQLAVFPVENHGFEEETSWADEYKRILNLFEDNLRGRGAAHAHTD